MTAAVEAVSDFDALASQIKTQSPKQTEKAQAEQPKEQENVKPEIRKSTLQKGEQKWDIDDDAEIEVNADKGKHKLTLRELKDRAAGDIAIKSRMQSLAEEKKKVNSTLKEFTSLARKDPLKALEFISERAKETDSDFGYDSYLTALANQAEKMAKMSPAEREAYDLKQKLQKAEGDLSVKQRQEALEERRRSIMDANGIRHDQFDRYLDAVTSNPEIMQGVNSEEQILDRVQYLAEETAIQSQVVKAIQKVDPSQSANEDLILSVAETIREIPDLDEEDIEAVIDQYTAPTRKTKAVQTLSQKQSRSMSPQEQMTDFEALSAQLAEEREKKKRR